MESHQHFVGADISKRTIDLYLRTSGRYLKISNDEKGFKELLRSFESEHVPLAEIVLVMEHTGYYSYGFEQFLHRQEIHFVKVSALAIKRSLGIVRGKSDRIDASRIAEYGSQHMAKLKFRKASSKAMDRLRLLAMGRNKYIKIRTSLLNTMEELKNMGVSSRDIIFRSQQTLVNSVNRQIEALEKEMEAVIREDEKLLTNYKLLKSIKGVGPIVAIHVLVKTNNFEWFDNARQFACYCGLAPFEYTSGSSIRGRTRVSHLADKQMKTLLDLAAKVAIQHDPELKEYYKRRLDEGKSKMSTLNVVRNKIVGRLFSVIKRQMPYISAVHEAA